jgi:predicted ArsR family transcriptional regulator
LCQGRQTVSELGIKLGVTDNAVRAQLQRLERDGLVSQAGARRGVRRPHVEYELAPKAYELFPKAYEPALRRLLDVLGERFSEEVVRELLVQAGRGFLDQHVVTIRGRGPRQRLAQIMSRLNGASLGIEVGQEGGKTVLRSCSCPLASVTAAHPEMCEALAAVLGHVLEAPHGVRQRCERDGVPRCRFEIAPSPQ